MQFPCQSRHILNSAHYYRYYGNAIVDALARGTGSHQSEDGDQKTASFEVSFSFVPLLSPRTDETNILAHCYTRIFVRGEYISYTPVQQQYYPTEEY